MFNRFSSWRRPAARIVVAAWLAALSIGVFTAGKALADDPKADPAGISTGDKSSAADASGTGFVVSEPTDKNAADYAAKKKAFDEYTAQAKAEPLAVKLADSVGHVRVGTKSASSSPRRSHASTAVRFESKLVEVRKRVSEGMLP